MLSVAKAACDEMNLSTEFRRGLLQTCWIITLDDPEVGVREVVVVRDPQGEFYSTLCLSPNCD